MNCRGWGRAAAIVCVVAAVSACGATQTGRGTRASGSPSISSSGAPASATPSSTTPHNPSPAEPRTRATSHASADIGALPLLPSDDCLKVDEQGTYLEVMQSMANTEYDPNGSLNSIFLGNAADLPQVLSGESMALVAVTDRATSAGYPNDNKIIVSLQSLQSAYAALIGSANAARYDDFFNQVVTAQTAYDDAIAYIGNNCMF